MVIDSSSVLAILFDQPERRRFNEAIEAAETPVVSAASFVEVSIVVESLDKGPTPVSGPGALAGRHGEL